MLFRQIKSEKLSFYNHTYFVKNYQKLIKHFKKNIPLKYPISVKRCKLPEEQDQAGCYLINNKFIIKIDKTIVDENYFIDIFIHEYAHAMSWQKEKNPHGRLWGIAHSKAYRAFLECFNLDEK